MKFHKQRAITTESLVRYCSFIDSGGYASGPIRRFLFIDYIIKTIIELEEDIMVLNNVTKFHKILLEIFELESGHRIKR